jgi:hypothetical protein
MPESMQDWQFAEFLANVMTFWFGNYWCVGHHMVPRGWSFSCWDGREFHTVARFNREDIA